jgi:hypothetical protein
MCCGSRPLQIPNLEPTEIRNLCKDPTFHMGLPLLFGTAWQNTGERIERVEFVGGAK